MKCLNFLIVACLLLGNVSASAATTWPGFVESGYNNEQVREIRFAEQARAIVVAPGSGDFDPSKPTVLVIYAAPNGNTAEQTLGCQLADGMDWHFDIQHAAAQWRKFRGLETDRNVVLACVQANNLSWPTWKGERSQGPQLIRQIVESLAESLPSKDVRVVLTSHSGGGSFLFGYLDAVEEIPPLVERIAFLDANYGYDNTQRHGEKIIAWLDADPSHRFVVLAYDDRNIELNGKKVVSPTGGTLRATHRMLDFVKEKTKVVEDKQGDFARYTAKDGRLTALIHPNPDNIILHTRLVGEMNGLLEALTIGTPYHNKWGKLVTPRAFSDSIQPEPCSPEKWVATAPALQQQRTDARGGTAVIEDLLAAEPAVREAEITKEILQGNAPNFWRQFKDVEAELKTADGKTHKIVYRVSPDYLMVGSNDDFVRVPLTPYTAQFLADMLGCVLPTRKMVEDIYQAAETKLVPQPLTEERESLATFFKHHQMIQEQWQNRHPTDLVMGIKKDVVITNEILKRPDHVAIYGWHQRDGKPIQPLTTVHIHWYVDYSHGIRLVDEWCTVDGQPMRVQDVLGGKELCGLLSDEGPLEYLSYQQPLKTAK